jgi:pyruvate dehydrogenase E2 component (dihydrolipoamide acetyltransferase)
MATGTVIEVVMPQMGVSVSEGTIVKWLRSEGEQIEADEALLEISTDKVDTEVPSPGTGVVARILVHEGETVDVGTKLAEIAPGGEAAVEPAVEPEPEPEPAQEPATAEATAEAGPASSAETPAPVKPEPAPVEPAPAPVEPAPASVEPEPAPVAPAPPAGSENGKTFVSPVVARIAAEHGVDVGSVEGTGQGGRVTKKDILAFIEAGPSKEAVSTAPTAAPPDQTAPAPTPPAPAAPAARAAPAEPSAPAAAPPVAASPQPEAAGPGERIEPMSAMRRGIAEHMRRSLDTAAHVTSAIEVDMSKVVAIRDQLKAAYQKDYGVNPTYLAFVGRAAVDTLHDYPWINGELRGEQIVTRSYVNLGIAVELADGKGLIVPVIKNAEGLNLLGLARSIADIAARARDKKLLPDDVQGGTFTITNPGGYGTFHGTPVISQPQAGILGTYALVNRPWVVQDQLGNDVIAIRPIMNITLTYDHRIVDGALAGRFLHDLREKLQTWGQDRY